MSEILIRRAEPSDAEGIASTFRARDAAAGTLQNPFPSVADWTRRLTDAPRTNYILVATVDGQIVGHGGLDGSSNPRRAHAWGIGMSVRDDWQGKGVGTRLMTALMDLADNWLGALRLELTVFSDNERAIALYRKFGFQMEGTHRAYALREGKLADVHAMARFHPHPPQLPGGT